MKKGKGIMGSPKATHMNKGLKGGAGQSLTSGPGKFAMKVKPNKSGKK